MSRYIDADKIEEVIRNDIPLKYFMTSSYNVAIKNGLKIAEILNDKIPTADVIEVVRCEKCKYYICKNGRDMCKRNAVYYECSQDYIGLVAICGRTHFCGYGVRMDGGVEE